jgi:sigma-B regulation protein RsbU (phosphoserine phosphatase)
MNLSIRIKIFAVLVAFSLLPLFLSRTVTGRAARTMADTLSGRTRTELLSIVTAELQHNAMSILRTVEARGQALRLGAMTLARQAGSLLDSPEPERMDAAWPSSPPARPSGGMPGPRYDKLVRNGRSVPLPVDFTTLSFHVSPFVRDPAPLAQAERLRALLPTFADVHAELWPAATWARVGLESGLLARYPGLDSFPMVYDHRDQPWYERVKEAGRPAWTLPHVDPTTRQVMAVIGYPVRTASGAFAGVAAVDVPIQSVLHQTDLTSRWSDDIRSYMVAPDGEGGLLILAQQAYEAADNRHWRAGIEPERMTSDDPEAFARLLDLMAGSSSGAMRLPHHGADSVWAFASNEDFSFLLIVPESVVSRLPDEVSGSLAAMFDRIRSVSAIISAVMLVITALLAWFGSRAITRPFIRLTEAAERLARGDFSARVTGPRTGDERDVMAASFNNMVPKLAEQMRLSRDLALAEGVQRLLLPGDAPAMPGYDISGGIVYCDQIGGDYYDFLHTATDHGPALGVILGDVSGHGVPSALIMASVRGQLHSLAGVPMSAGQRLTAINASLAHDLDGTGRFLTLFYLELGGSDGIVRWVRAGHDPAIRHTPGTDSFGELDGEGIPLGVLGDFAYREQQTVLEPGEILALATDGVWEARDTEGRMFGKQRMLALIRENAHKSAQDIRAAVMAAVDLYQGGVREDDTAVVVIKRTGPYRPGQEQGTPVREHAEHMDTHVTSFRMSNKMNCFKRFQPEVEEFGLTHGLSPRCVFHLTLTLDELITNIISYGYADFDEHPIDVTISLEGDSVTIRVEDDAEPFNILEAPDPELEVPLDERTKPIGGMGIHLVRTMMDHIEYAREDGRNILLLRKRICNDCPPTGERLA